MQHPFRHRFRVRYAEVDPQAVVFNSRYLEYADIVVTEFFRERGIMAMADDPQFHVRRAEIDYLVPIRADEWIEGRLTVERIGTSSILMRIALTGVDNGDGDGDDDLRAVMALTQVHVDLATGRPQPVPDAVRAAFGFPVQAQDG